MTESILILNNQVFNRTDFSSRLTEKFFRKILNHPAEILNELKHKKYSIFISDLQSCGKNFENFLNRIKSTSPETKIILTSNIGNEEMVYKALSLNLHDSLIIPFNLPELFTEIEYYLNDDFESKEIEKEKEIIWPENIIGFSPVMNNIFNLVKNIADKDISVLIGGESGTGKELIASAIHNLSLRKKGPFIKVNCAAIPENLIESELFGHEKGSFTGAFERKIGKFELAHNGTIFLDEIGDMAFSTQAKVLRVVENREFERIGGIKTIKVDIRIISATNHDLQNAIREKQFREDLYYRLNVVSLNLPPLRDHKEDIIHLADYFRKLFCRKFNKNVTGFSNNVMEIFKNYDWPGNIRELKNVIESSIALENGAVIRTGSLPYELDPHHESVKTSIETLSNPIEELISSGNTLEEIEALILKEALKISGGNRIKAGKLLGLGKGATQYKYKKLGLAR